ncbi:MAG: ribonuclease P protein component [Chlamydiales bacterium]
MLKFCFPRQARLLTPKQYRLVDRQGKEYVGCFIRLHVRKTQNCRQKLGITVSRRFGKATARNRFKRIVREAFRLSQHELPSNVQINVRPMKLAQEATTALIQEELFLFLRDLANLVANVVE